MLPAIVKVTAGNYTAAAVFLRIFFAARNTTIQQVVDRYLKLIIYYKMGLYKRTSFGRRKINERQDLWALAEVLQRRVWYLI